MSSESCLIAELSGLMAPWLPRKSYFATFQGLKHSSLKSYLSSLRHMQISYGLEDPFTVPMPQLEQVVKGIKVNQGCQGRNTPNQKLLVTHTILRQLKGLRQQREQELDYIMMWAAVLCVLFGFLRLGEITVLNRSAYDPTSHLSYCDLPVDDREHPTMLQLNLKSSKRIHLGRGSK